MKKGAIVLASGGLDSTVTAYYVKKKLSYNPIIFLFFDYGQKTLKQEEFFARKQALLLKASFVKIDLTWIKKISRSLIHHGKNVVISRKDLNSTKKVGNWYVPARNTLFISCALAFAESLFLDGRHYDIFLGFKNEGQLHYPDTTSPFVRAFNRLKKSAIQSDSLILAPLLKYDKDQVILLGKELGVDYRKTYSCYLGAGKKHCGICMNCRLRQEGFYWAHLPDPTHYVKKSEDYRDYTHLGRDNLKNRTS